MENVRFKVPLDYTYFHIESNPQEDVFRIKGVTNAAEADEWVRKVAKENKTTWRTGKTYPNAGVKVVYRKDYRCQHLTDKRCRGSRISKNTDCPAKLFIAIQRYRENSKSQFNSSFLKDFQAEVVFKGKHNHPLNYTENMRYSNMSDEIKAKLTKLLLERHSPSSALNSLKLDLMCKNPDNYSKITADGSNLPSLGSVYRLYNKIISDVKQIFEGERMPPDLKEIAMSFMSNSEGTIRYHKTKDGLHSYVVVITTLMMQCHRIVKQSCNTVMLDSSVVIDKHRIRAHIFTTDGGLPLGIVLTDGDKEYVLIEALKCYRGLLHDIAFYSVGYPKIFLTNNYMKERNCLKTVFPMASVFLCQFHVLKSMWSWLCCKTHNIDVGHRQSFYFLFKRVVYSYEESHAEEKASDFIEEAKSLGYPKLVDHFNSLWVIKHDWVSCYREELLAQYSEQECCDNTILFERAINREVTAEEQLELECLVARIKDRVSTNPGVFVPAFRKMLENARNFAATDSGLLSAMNSFATEPTPLLASTSHGAVPIECTPNNVAIKTPQNTKHLMSLREKLIERRKKSLFRQRKLRSSRLQDPKVPPQLQQHDYTAFRAFPTKKRKHQDNLKRSVIINKGIGNNIEEMESESPNSHKEVVTEMKEDTPDKIIYLMNVDYMDFGF